MVGLSGHRIPDGPQGGGFYCATKSAIKTITEGLRQEVGGGCGGGRGGPDEGLRQEVGSVPVGP